ncbi:MAG: hydroxymethylpyrimidine/phosphomethylpyrimidine kinase [Hahellaceae bacterium]|nr:hydroxymethylpyrimidine/phosphomethylpyrimidine kinase [Hahellaceae bacterium]MCP5168513.1 hydroxymethylpyrimidine/phosphomethylpyrimidine kinase [Hahellaceae bacterium]
MLQITHPVRPAVLCVSGFDPLGCAGLLADQRMLLSQGCHVAAVVSTLTVQSSTQFVETCPVDPDIAMQQLHYIFSDLPIAAIKVGAIGSAAIAEVLAGYLRARQDIPVIIDPVLGASGGGQLNREEGITALASLLPHCTLLTPNGPEAQQLTGLTETNQAARTLLSRGCKNVLITGGHDVQENTIDNFLLTANEGEHRFSIPRIQGDFRGTGCALASAITGYMAHGVSLIKAVEQAQLKVSAAIQRATRLSSGKRILNPVYE